MNRRDFIRRAIATSVLAAVTASGAFEMLARASAGQQAQAPTVSQAQSGSQTTPAPAGYAYVTQLSSLGSQTSAYFTHPQYGNSMLISLNGQWKAFSATCTHRPCTVQYRVTSIYCPCHGATFNPSNGGVTGGPAPSKLPEFGVLLQNGLVYVTTSTIN